MKQLRNFFSILLVMLSSITLHAQGHESTVGKFMRSDERAYVVIAVILAIFIGILLYLVRLERKINKLEKENKQ